MRFVIVGCIVSGFLSMASVSSAVEYIWQQKADMPTPRWNLATCVVDGKIYALGGERSEGGEGSWRLSAMEEYDPATNTWTVKTDIPNGRVASSSSVVSGKIFAIGGRGGSSNLSRVEEYDPVTDTWATKADMPTPRWMLSTCVVDGKIYAVGGTPRGMYAGLKNTEEYDPVADSWTRRADMPAGVWALCACAVNGRIYALGGRPGQHAVPNVQEYDPATDTWTRRADMPVATSQMASAVIDDKIYVIGGWRWSLEPPYTTVQIYDPATDTWAIGTNVPFLRAASSASVVNGRIFVIGGTDRPHPCPAMSSVYELGPLLDFDRDGIVDGDDLCIMVDRWHTDDLLCDIAPSPFGDGIVNIEDLKVMAQHLFEESLPAELIGYWRLDEEEGNMAYDSAGHNAGLILGDPLWRPYEGKRGGALELDGIDDYVEAGFVLNPAYGAFSVLAWIKGGAPGQVIISQGDSAIGSGSMWLGTDTSDGRLMTGLTPHAGRSKPMPLGSEHVITDGQWHHVSLVWGGAYRYLYVDGAEAARDTATQPGLDGSTGGLFFGVGSALAPSTFFSGLIDEIRVYNIQLSAHSIAALAQ